MKQVVLFGCLLPALITIVLTYAQSSQEVSKGQLIYDKIFSPALEGNKLGDSAEREMTIYLPPGYDTSDDTSYPVLYLLHGYKGAAERSDEIENHND